MQYPKNMLEFIDSFHTEEQCLLYLEQLRWGWVCPKCGSEKYWRRNKRRVRICAWCRSSLCVTAWTVLHRLRIPLRALLLIWWMMVTSKQWISSEELSLMLGIDDKTARLWSNKFRKIMVLDDRKKLSSDVEVDEVFIGGSHSWIRGRGAEWKIRIVIAVEVNMSKPNKTGLLRGTGRVRIKAIPNCGEQTLTRFINENIESGAHLYTDGWLGYKNIDNQWYFHTIESALVADSEVVWIYRPEVTPNVHIVASLLKRWLLGTHQKYLVQDGYLQEYLEEYTFRYNRRKSSDRWKLFRTLMEQIITHMPTTRKQIETKATVSEKSRWR